MSPSFPVGFRPLFFLLCILLSLTLFSRADGDGNGEDWPMWRGDARRSGTTAAKLARGTSSSVDASICPLRDLPGRMRNGFNLILPITRLSPEKLIIIASPNDGSVAAFDTETGSEQWRFFTDGPVRVAPAANADGQVFVGSDDGYLYCLDAKTGKPVWKIRAAPEDRPEYRHLGNARLVSYWPVRGGPVVSDDGKTVYFGSGIWPSMGVFVFAADTETGETSLDEFQFPLPSRHPDRSQLPA